ncbi:MAG: aminoacyl--tRNA ligase-related protein, partial [Candidatus Thiodiazotropha sp.]
TAIKDHPAEEDSVNARLLIRAGYIRKLMAGTYSYLPLGQRVLMKIEALIREEMGRIGSQEILMPALQPSEPWQQTGRWEKMDKILFKLKGAGDRDLTLGSTHEEIVTPLIGTFVKSYRDLPVSVFQIQTKFRNEKRAKSGLLRGREFRMKEVCGDTHKIAPVKTSCLNITV